MTASVVWARKVTIQQWRTFMSFAKHNGCTTIPWPVSWFYISSHFIPLCLWEGFFESEIAKFSFVEPKFKVQLLNVYAKWCIDTTYPSSNNSFYLSVCSFRLMQVHNYTFYITKLELLHVSFRLSHQKERLHKEKIPCNRSSFVYYSCIVSYGVNINFVISFGSVKVHVH